MTAPALVYCRAMGPARVLVNGADANASPEPAFETTAGAPAAIRRQRLPDVSPNVRPRRLIARSVRAIHRSSSSG